MLTNKTIEIIRICMNITLATVKNHTDDEKLKQDIKNALTEFNEHICNLEDEIDKED